MCSCCLAQPPQEGEGFRAAASSRMHRLTLHFFKATRTLKRAPAPLRLLIQARQAGWGEGGGGAEGTTCGQAACC